MKKLISLIAILCLTLTLASCSQTAGVTVGTPEMPETPLPEFSVDILKVGKADCIFLRSDGETLMIDTAESENLPTVESYIEKNGITKIDTLLLTHLDKDHIGCADYVVKNLEVGRIIQSRNDEQSEEYTAFTDACKEKGKTSEKLTKDTEITVGSVKVVLLASKQSFYNDDNDYSIVASVVYGARSLLFAADATTERLKEFIADNKLEYDFVKYPHHGNFCESTEAFIESVKPKTAVFSTSKKNPPDNRVSDMLENLGTQTYITGDGTVHITCDGIDLKAEQ